MSALLDRLLVSRTACERGIERMDEMIRTNDGAAQQVAAITRRDWARACYLIQARIEREEREYADR